MSAASVLYDTVGTVESAISRTRVWRRLCWLAEDVRGVWSAMSAIPWTGADEPVRVPWGTDGYQPPGLERILPDPPLDRDAALRAADRRVDRATPDELDRLLTEILSDGGDAA